MFRTGSSLGIFGMIGFGDFEDSDSEHLCDIHKTKVVHYS